MPAKKPIRANLSATSPRPASRSHSFMSSGDEELGTSSSVMTDRERKVAEEEDRLADELARKQQKAQETLARALKAMGKNETEVRQDEEGCEREARQDLLLAVLRERFEAVAALEAASGALAKGSAGLRVALAEEREQRSQLEAELTEAQKRLAETQAGSQALREELAERGSELQHAECELQRLKQQIYQMRADGLLQPQRPAGPVGAAFALVKAQAEPTAASDSGAIRANNLLRKWVGRLHRAAAFRPPQGGIGDYACRLPPWDAVGAQDSAGAQVGALAEALAAMWHAKAGDLLDELSENLRHGDAEEQPETQSLLATTAALLRNEGCTGARALLLLLARLEGSVTDQLLGFEVGEGPQDLRRYRRHWQDRQLRNPALPKDFPGGLFPLAEGEERDSDLPANLPGGAPKALLPLLAWALRAAHEEGAPAGLAAAARQQLQRWVKTIVALAAAADPLQGGQAAVGVTVALTPDSHVGPAATWECFRPLPDLSPALYAEQAALQEGQRVGLRQVAWAAGGREGAEQLLSGERAVLQVIEMRRPRAPGEEGEVVLPVCSLLEVCGAPEQRQSQGRRYLEVRLRPAERPLWERAPGWGRAVRGAAAELSVAEIGLLRQSIFDAEAIALVSAAEELIDAARPSTELKQRVAALAAAVCPRSPRTDLAPLQQELLRARERADRAERDAQMAEASRAAVCASRRSQLTEDRSAAAELLRKRCSATSRIPAAALRVVLGELGVRTTEDELPAVAAPVQRRRPEGRLKPPSRPPSAAGAPSEAELDAQHPDVLWGGAGRCRRQGDRRGEMRHLTHFLRQAQAVGDTEREVKACRYLAQHHLDHRDLDRAEEWYDRLFRVADATGDDDAKVRAATALGDICGQRGRFDRAQYYFSRARVFAESRNMQKRPWSRRATPPPPL
eukprot:TRINITY_DN70847_c0_g1_i1.p1 TRINITY_DN70847_c0_g1~~TRINITY_DN70847_c0_g1_i1.p1  ORF type:complete len:948 (+),score=287.10 TRINITY_DN70847_c0_g1_i1:107-2845(+)